MERDNEYPAFFISRVANYHRSKISFSLLGIFPFIGKNFQRTGQLYISYLLSLHLLYDKKTFVCQKTRRKKKFSSRNYGKFHGLGFTKAVHTAVLTQITNINA